MKTKNLVANSIFAAIICLFSVVTVPIGAVPVTLSLFAVVVASIVLGAKNSAIAVLVYIFLGATGLPVFAGFGGGLSVIFGPTGGFILSYVPVCLIIGSVSHKSSKHLYFSAFCALIVSYIMGTLWFCIVQSTTIASSVMVCVVPFVVFDIIKFVIALNIGKAVSKILKL